MSDNVGRLMEFWGFKRNMGRLWAVLYLSPEPQSAEDLRQQLQLSSGAVSMTLSELSRWGVVRKVWVQGERKDFYAAEVQLWRMISRVFNEREKTEINVAIEAFTAALVDVEAMRHAGDAKARARAELQTRADRAPAGAGEAGGAAARRAPVDGEARCRAAGPLPPRALVTFALVASAFGATSLTAGGARAAGSSTPAPITSNNYALEFYQGPLIGPNRLLGMAGAYTAVAEGIDGATVNAASPAVREPFSFDWVDYDVDVDFSLPGAYGGTDFDNHGPRVRFRSCSRRRTGFSTCTAARSCSSATSGSRPPPSCFSTGFSPSRARRG